MGKPFNIIYKEDYLGEYVEFSLTNKRDSLKEKLRITLDTDYFEKEFKDSTAFYIHVSAKNKGDLKKGYVRSSTWGGRNDHLHRLVYLYYNKSIPKFSNNKDGLVIDHINGNSLDNRIRNLRILNLSKNLNRSRASIFPMYKGVSISMINQRGNTCFQAYKNKTYFGYGKTYNDIIKAIDKRLEKENDR